MGKDYDSIQISRRHYRLNYKSTADNGVILTGGTDITLANMPFTFQLLRIELTHRNSSNVLTDIEYEFYVQRTTGDILDIALACTATFTKKQINDQRALVDFTDKELVFESGTHQFIFIGTATEKIIPLIYIKELQ